MYVVDLGAGDHVSRSSSHPCLCRVPAPYPHASTRTHRLISGLKIGGAVAAGGRERRAAESYERQIEQERRKREDGDTSVREASSNGVSGSGDKAPWAHREQLKRLKKQVAQVTAKLLEACAGGGGGGEVRGSPSITPSPSNSLCCLSLQLEERVEEQEVEIKRLERDREQKLQQQQEEVCR